MIRRPFVRVMSNEDAVLKDAGSAKTVSQPILPENEDREREDNSWMQYDVQRTEKLVQSA